MITFPRIDRMNTPSSHSEPEPPGKHIEIEFATDLTNCDRPSIGLGYSEEHFHSLIENVSDTIAMINAQGIICYVSPSVERMLGYRPDELLGKSAFDLIY